MTLADSTFPTLLVLLLTSVGMIVGSFLNLVIYRLPIMRKRAWSKQAETTLAEFGPAQANETPFNLSFPGSHCPNCGHGISPLENIPLISYLLLRGRCSNCRSVISPRYPLVEVITGLLTLTVLLQFGLTFTGLMALILTWCLITLALIDLDTYLLPDEITLPLIWAGLLVNTGHLFTDIYSSVWGAAGGYLSLWCVYQGFKLASGREGMGFGDFKLLSALGAWFGWQLLMAIVLLSSISGLVYALLRRLTGVSLSKELPFGPFLALAGWIALMWGEHLLAWYGMI